jgi:hypothetical protein
LTDAPRVSPLGAPIVFDAGDSAGRVGIIRIEPPEKIVTPRAAGVVAEPAYLSITAVLVNDPAARLEDFPCSGHGCGAQIWTYELGQGNALVESLKRSGEWPVLRVGGEEQPGAVIVPRMLEGQKRKILDVRTLQFARISEQAS